MASTFEETELNGISDRRRAGLDGVNLVFLQTFHRGKANDRPAVVGKSESAFELLYWGHLGSPI